MLRKAKRMGVGLVFFQAVCLSSVSAAAPVLETVYDFSEHVREAEAYSHSLEGAMPIIALFKDNEFQFDGLPQTAVIKSFDRSGPDAETRGIQFNPQSNRAQKLIFKEVLPASFLRYTYQFFIPSGETNVSFIHFRIWVGKKLLKHERIIGRSEAKKEDLDMGLAGFLNKPVDITFEIVSNGVISPETLFEFKAELVNSI